MSETEKLKSVQLFRNFSAPMLAEFAGYFRKVSAGAGDVLFKEKSEGDALYIIVEGEVVIEKALDSEGSEFKTLAILSAGDFFGEMAVIETQPRFAQARAAKAAELYEVGRQQFFSFIKEHPEAGASLFGEIMRTISRRLQHTSSELTMLFDLSRLLLLRHSSPAEFISAVMREIVVYLPGVWNVRAYVYNLFNEEYEQAYTAATFQGASFKLPARPENGWVSDSAYVMDCSAEGRRLACAVFEREVPLSMVEKNNLATIFNTISSIAGSAMLNIGHQAEAALMEKLRNRKNSI
jgi:CRP-like cAMP-binding protein